MIQLELVFNLQNPKILAQLNIILCENKQIYFNKEVKLYIKLYKQ